MPNTPNTSLLKPNKSCPIVLRQSDSTPHLLVFRHPLAGIQLVKGSIEPGEKAAVATIRELYEESGIQQASVSHHLGVWETGFEGQIWSFHRCTVPSLPDEWQHFTTDGGGHHFAFFWHPLAAPPTNEWHPLFQNALAWLQQRLLP